MRCCRVAGNLPAFERDTEYVSLKQDTPPTYTFYHGDITSHRPQGGPVPVNKWKTVANEYVCRSRPPSGPSGIATRTR